MMDKLTVQEYGELFELQVRGRAATAFAYGEVPPGDYWPLLRGEVEITMRDIGEIGYLTGFNMHLDFLRGDLEESGDSKTDA